MSTPIVRKTQSGRVIARSSDGRVIREAQIYDPMANVEKAWRQTGEALRVALDSQNKATFSKLKSSMR
ncbi:hypothetical protein [Corynebacterium cystitidis]|uniref:hypothetical protein n=1 Tax=Corynebacterium cystitidis TaxID=35757 RepID=UPI00211F055F|nr:hypothetical protein [Corynebacterium cystitidis]